jgi:hypothetical protein
MSKTFKITRWLRGQGRLTVKGGCVPCAKKKHLTHKLERRAALRGIHSELDEVAA